MQEEHRQKLEIEALARQQTNQHQPPQPQVKLAPWAKASEENVSRDLSLCEIQVEYIKTVIMKYFFPDFFVTSET